MLGVLIVDDEPLARDRIRRMVSALGEYKVVGEAANGEQALAACEQLQPDILCLDIRMPGMDGLAVARALAQQTQAPAVIFCTAYDDYALAAFEANALGYLLKPVRAEKLAQALGKAQRLTRPQLQALQHSLGHDEAMPCLTVNRRDQVLRIPFSEARVLAADHKYVTLYHTGGEDLLDDSLKQLEQRFGDQLVRVHRNALVVRHAILGMEKDSLGRYQLRVADIDYRPTVSRRHVSELRRLIAEN